MRLKQKQRALFSCAHKKIIIKIDTLNCCSSVAWKTKQQVYILTEREGEGDRMFFEKGEERQRREGGGQGKRDSLATQREREREREREKEKERGRDI